MAIPQSLSLGFFAPADVADLEDQVTGEEGSQEYDDEMLEVENGAVAGAKVSTEGTTLVANSFRELFAPTVNELQKDSVMQIAGQYWLDADLMSSESVPAKKSKKAPKGQASSAKANVDVQSVIDLVYDQEIVSSQYSVRKLMMLEFSGYLEKYLWPAYVPESARPKHVVSIAMMVNEKARQRIPNFWEPLVADPEKFSALFTSILSQSTNQDGNYIHEEALLLFILNACRSLEIPIVRQQVLRLVNIHIWGNIINLRREIELSRAPALRKAWNKAERKASQLVGREQQRHNLDASYVSNLVKFFLQLLDRQDPPDGEKLSFCERAVEFFVELLSQLPTRRYVRTLLSDHLVIIVSLMNVRHMDSDVATNFSRLVRQLEESLYFEFDDISGNPISRAESIHIHIERVQRFQRICFSKYREETTKIAYVVPAKLKLNADLFSLLNELDDDILKSLCSDLGYRTSFPIKSQRQHGRDLFIAILVSELSYRERSLDQVDSEPLHLNEKQIFEESAVHTSAMLSHGQSLPIPKLNLQFLSVFDYLLRNFRLFRLDNLYSAQLDIEDAVRRLSPVLEFDPAVGKDRTVFRSWARMAAPVVTSSVVQITDSTVGENVPRTVEGVVTYSTAKFTDRIRREWATLRRHDVVFLVTLTGSSVQKTAEKGLTGIKFRDFYGIKCIRGCEVVDALDKDGKPLREKALEEIEQSLHSAVHTLKVEFDPTQYSMDVRSGKTELYGDFNVLIRRRPQESNFKSVLSCIRDLMHCDVVLPEWIQDVFLGYGDPRSANFENLSYTNTSLDFQDTFLDWGHVEQSFPLYKSILKESHSDDESNPARFVLSFVSANEPKTSAPQKRVRGEDEMLSHAPAVSEVHATKYAAEIDPYSKNSAGSNRVRFTPTQVQAIRCGMSKGLTLVVGPPGTGKTDVAVQIVSNLYHNFPNEKILLITHSNQALNQLFEKIAKLNVDPCHLLRLGHGEEDLTSDSAGGWGKLGRVNAFLEARTELLNSVERLAVSLNIPGAHGYSCETAGYFYAYHVCGLWELFLRRTESAKTVAEISTSFPFTAYFGSNEALFATAKGVDSARASAELCFQHLRTIFEKLDGIRAFELLRHGQDRNKYLLVKEARVVAMTCTYAALKRSELASAGFRYDSVIMEEAGQILEIESFFPLVMQNVDPETGSVALKRIVMIGDHHQLPPVVKNPGLQRFSNLQQSLFERLIRLGVTTIELDQQARCRTSIADLFRWRYRNLSDLPSVISSSPRLFACANPGFAFEYQFINVEDYNGKGETEPIPYFYQNLGEAEYAVAVYQYMRLLGYPASKISILTTYNGQRALIEDVLERRCRWNPIFGLPGAVSTVDKYQGQQNDYVLLSLVRTNSVGHLRDVRRLVVALSRARLGLYIFGRRKVFENCMELQHSFAKLLSRPSSALWLRGGESWDDGFERPVAETGVEYGGKGWAALSSKNAFEMEDVAHMGKYVHNMLQEQIRWLKEQEGVEGPEMATQEAEVAK